MLPIKGPRSTQPTREPPANVLRKLFSLPGTYSARATVEAITRMSQLFKSLGFFIMLVPVPFVVMFWGKVPTGWLLGWWGEGAPPNGSFTQVASGYRHSCGIRSDQSVVCWGDNTRDQVTAPTGAFIQIDAGDFHSCGVKTDNTIACWGNNSYGQSAAPTGRFNQVAAGGGHSCAVRANGTIACWGGNADGQSVPPLP